MQFNSDKLFFTSDTHFLHRNILTLCSRPFKDINEQIEIMTFRWNQKVTADSDVFHLGDISLGSNTRTIEILKRLNGRLHFLKGNHDDSKLFQHLAKEGHFTESPLKHIYVTDEDAYKGRRLLVLCHYPMLVWDKGARGAWHLHGHCHGFLNEVNKATTRLDVGVDSFNYTPVSYEEIKLILGQRSYLPVDHHNEGTDYGD